MKAGLFTQDEFKLFARCEEFLWRVRCHLHFATGRAEERLTFDLQRSIAERIGYAARGGLSGVERFMKALLPDRQGCRRPHGHRLRRARGAPDQAPPGARPHVRPLPPPARRRAGGRRLHRRQQPPQRRCDEDAFERDPVNLIRLFWLADRHNLRDPSRRDAARHPLAAARSARPAQRPGGQQALSRHPDLAQRAGGGAAADERDRACSAASSRISAASSR